MAFSQEEIQQYKLLQSSPLIFVEKVWGLTPQPALQEHLAELTRITHLEGKEWNEQKSLIGPHFFGTIDPETERYTWLDFQRGKHLTWQQYLVLLSMEKALHKKAPCTISISSGKGIGKSTTLSMLILWFLFSFPDSQVAATAPGFQQLYDVLWKELALWIQRMPPSIRDMYEWESSHIRIKESPATWFARAKTASKESPEALSGIHADYVLAVVDEASGVEDPIFAAAQGIFSSPNAFMILISNPTKRHGYFFRSHHSAKDNWQTFKFSSIDSPIVDEELVRQYAVNGIASDEYRIGVLGEFPAEDVVDSNSYIQLIPEAIIRMERPLNLTFHSPILGVDPAFEGSNISAYSLRDNFFGQIVATEDKSTSKSIARTIINLADKYRINPKDIVLDAFGSQEVGAEVALARQWSITSINVAEKCEDNYDNDLFFNKRAEMYWKLKQWLERGGILMENKELRDELLSIRFRRTEAGGKIQIMSKREMRNIGIKSPDLADSLAITFFRKPGSNAITTAQQKANQSQPFNKWGV